MRTAGACGQISRREYRYKLRQIGISESCYPLASIQVRLLYIESLYLPRYDHVSHSKLFDLVKTNRFWVCSAVSITIPSQIIAEKGITGGQVGLQTAGSGGGI